MITRNRVVGFAAAVAMIATFEGLRLTGYLDPIGVPTVCYGHTATAVLGEKWTKAECDKMLEREVIGFWDDVDRLVTVPINPNMHAAFTSFAYNVGTNAFAKSTMRKKVNRGDYIGACNELSRWVMAGRQVFSGLITRRAKERATCLGIGGYAVPLYWHDWRER